MSTSASIANFAVDAEGREVPIRYKAEDLVNHQAPEGYAWQMRTKLDDLKEEFYANYDARFPVRVARYEAEQASRAKRTEEELSRVDLWFPPAKKPVHDVDGDWHAQHVNFYLKEKYTVPYYVAKRIA
jgi:hypothetical protein